MTSLKMRSTVLLDSACLAKCQGWEWDSPEPVAALGRTHHTSANHLCQARSHGQSPTPKKYLPKAGFSCIWEGVWLLHSSMASASEEISHDHVEGSKSINQYNIYIYMCNIQDNTQGSRNAMEHLAHSPRRFHKVMSKPSGEQVCRCRLFHPSYPQ